MHPIAGRGTNLVRKLRVGLMRTPCEGTEMASLAPEGGNVMREVLTVQGNTQQVLLGAQSLLL